MPVRPATLALLTNFLIPDCTALRRLKIVMPTACMIKTYITHLQRPSLLGVALGFAVSETGTTHASFVSKDSSRVAAGQL